jgi:hypothetical protein
MTLFHSFDHRFDLFFQLKCIYILELFLVFVEIINLAWRSAVRLDNT